MISLSKRHFPCSRIKCASVFILIVLFEPSTINRTRPPVIMVCSQLSMLPVGLTRGLQG